MYVYHEPVLGAEVLDLLDPRGAGLYFDGTVGGGGHARLILERCPACSVFGVDRDPDALEHARTTLARFGDRVELRHARFDEALTERESAEGLDGALLDLGVSSHQIDAEARGFTFARGAALDMRMDASGGPDSSCRCSPAAACASSSPGTRTRR